jgi:hypothetical protein
MITTMTTSDFKYVMIQYAQHVLARNHSGPTSVTNKTDGHDIHHVVEILLNTDPDIVEAT